MKKILLFLLVFVMAFATLAGCKNNDSSSSSLMLFSDVIELKVGSSQKVLYYAKNTDKKVKFSSNNTNIATVDEDGNVVAVSVGETNINAKLGKGEEGKVLIRVTPAPMYRLWSSTNEVVIIKGRTFPLEVQLKKDSKVANDAVISFKSLDENIAVVNEHGAVLAVNNGQTQVEISCVYDGKLFCEYIPISVHPDAVIDTDSNITVYMGETVNVFYRVKTFNGQLIPDAQISLTAKNDVVSVEDTKIIGQHMGKTTVELNYQGVKKDVAVECLYKANKEEYNEFRDIGLLDSLSVDTGVIDKKDADYMAVSIIDSDVSGNTESKLFATNSKDGTEGNFHRKWWYGFYIPPMQTKQAITKLRNEGYQSLQLKICIDKKQNTNITEKNNSLYISSYVVNGDNNDPGITGKMNTSNVGGALKNNTWYAFNIDINKVIDNYQILINKEQPLFAVWMGTPANMVSAYNVYVAPLSFVKDAPSTNSFIELP